MKKADIAILLSPSIVFIAITIVALWMVQITKHRPSMKDRDRQQKWERFLEKLDSGKWELNYDKATEDSMLEAMRVSYRIAAAEQAVSESLNEFHQALVAFATAGAVFQVAVVFSVRKRLRKKWQLTQGQLAKGADCSAQT